MLYLILEFHKEQLELEVAVDLELLNIYVELITQLQNYQMLHLL